MEFFFNTVKTTVLHKNECGFLNKPVYKLSYFMSCSVTYSSAHTTEDRWQYYMEQFAIFSIHFLISFHIEVTYSSVGTQKYILNTKNCDWRI